MPVGTVTTKGQVTIPKAIRDRLRLKPGTRLSFVVGREGVVTMKRVSTDIRSLKGIIKSPFNRPITLEEMDEAIARGAAGLK
jgi:antitoxin PrlF